MCLLFAKSFQTCYAYNVTSDDLKKVPSYVPRDIQIDTVKQLNLSQSYKVLTNPENKRKLFPGQYFGISMLWWPYLLNVQNLRAAAQTNDVTVTFSADGSTCESLAFHSLLPVRDGATRVGIWVYGSGVSARVAAAHVLYWLQTPHKATTSKEFRLLLQLSCHVNKDEFKSHLVERLGTPEFSDAFDTDECFTVSKPILRQVGN